MTYPIEARLLDPDEIRAVRDDGTYGISEYRVVGLLTEAAAEIRRLRLLLDLRNAAETPLGPALDRISQDTDKA